MSKLSMPKALLVTCILAWSAGASAQLSPAPTPTGNEITPTAMRGAFLQDLNPGHANAPDVRAAGPASLAVSPDGKWLAILAGGLNQFFDRNDQSPPELNDEYVFLFDITGPQPKQTQVFLVPASFQGLAWSPSSQQLFVSEGVKDAVLEILRKDNAFVAGRTLQLGHKKWNGPDADKFAVTLQRPCSNCGGEVGGLAVSPDGKTLLVANVSNDSVSLIDIASGRILSEQDLRPGVIDPSRHGVPGGTYPRAVVWATPRLAFVASERDREVIALDMAGAKMRVARRFPVVGQPVALLANRTGSRLYVALDTTSHVAIFDTRRDKPIETLDVVAPKEVFENTGKLGGANTNALVLLPDERTLLVANGGENAIAVVALSAAARGVELSKDHDEDAAEDQSCVVGLVPTGWYPSGLGISKDGNSWYVVNGKNVTGPNISWCVRLDSAGHCLPESKKFDQPPIPFGEIVTHNNQHLEQLEKASLLSFPAPSLLELAALTKQVAKNDRFDTSKTADDEKVFAFLHEHIKHVIYILKENRTYDQVLGDLEVGNGDRRFNEFPDAITPNQHAIARNFVDLDNFLVSGEGSPQGYTWTYAATDTDYNERNEPHFYAGRGLIYDQYGNNRGVNTGYADSKERHAEAPISPEDPDILPGTNDVNAPDGPGGLAGKGYLWDAALKKGLTIRNYGLSPSFILSFYGGMERPMIQDPFAKKQRVMFTTKPALMPYTDPYFYTLDCRLTDFWRVQEWKREFAAFSASKTMPNLTLMWLGTDHMGAFEDSLDGVNTPDTQMAGNDLAVGQVVEAVANSPFANDTMILSVEDDAWDGADHVDAHRTIAFIAGAYVRQHAVVSKRYTTVSMVKTIEEILGIGPLGLNDALAAPMSDAFDPSLTSWSFKAIVPDVLRSTKLPLPPDEHARIAYPRHSAAYWARVMKDQDFSGPDKTNPVTFNRELWRGLKGNTPYPAINDSDK
jgi:DNA-binding beta-propeller fold protein YncE